MAELYSFGEWLRLRRQALLLSREDLARQVGCAVVTLRKIEADERKPSQQVAERLAELLDLTGDERTLFIQAARGIVGVDRLPTPISRGGAAPAPAVSLVSAPTMPSGTVSFLFTDIQGSTQLWEQHPKAMPAALARHDAILRQAITAHSGVIFKTIGDAFCAAFARATDAVAATLTAQRALHQEAWGATGSLRVRIALHTGVAEERDGDYFGQPLNRLARLLSAGHGGQILLSLATAELVREHLPADAELRDLGIHRLKDLSRAEQIFQLVVPDLPANFPLLNTLDVRRTNLPAQPTPLIGREREVAGVCALLRREDVRLVTLTGPGGTGKTRLGVQVAAELLDDFVDGVFFVDLAPINDPALVTSTIAQTLGVKESGGRPPLEDLKAYLREKRLLLLLDNFEQVLDAAVLVAELLKSASALKALVTSREVLHLRGEKEFAVPPLALPHLPLSPGWERGQGGEGNLSQYAAVQLFIARAQDAKLDFGVSNQNAPAVAEICARLDGLPLAIELAAARIKLFTPEALLARLSQRLQILTGGARDLPARQQALRNTIDWSYQLLDEGERRLFARLGVFVGGWTLEAAEAATALNVDTFERYNVLDGLASLADKSLVKQLEGIDGAPRFTMLETIREYALERLETSGELQTSQQQHLAAYLALAELAEPRLSASNVQVWLDRLEQEHDNLRAALTWALDHDLEAALRLGVALFDFWYTRGHRSEGRAWLEHALAHAGALRRDGAEADQAGVPEPHINTALWAKALYSAGCFAQAQDDDARAAALFAESLALARALGDSHQITLLLLHLGGIAHDQGDAERATTLCTEGLALAHAINDRPAIASLLAFRSDIAWAQGDLRHAMSYAEEVLAIQRSLDDQRGISRALRGLGELALEQGAVQRASDMFAEALTLARLVGDQGNIAWLLYYTGRLAFEQRNLADAVRRFMENAQLFDRLGFSEGVALSLASLADVAIEQRELVQAARFLGAAAAQREPSSWLQPTARANYDRATNVVRTDLDAATVIAAWAAGQAMSLAQALTEAQAMLSHVAQQDCTW